VEALEESEESHCLPVKFLVVAIANGRNTAHDTQTTPVITGIGQEAANGSVLVKRVLSGGQELLLVPNEGRNPLRIPRIDLPREGDKGMQISGRFYGSNVYGHD
jgi:hypothetical protein